MLNDISWGLFFIYTGGALLVYYFVLVVIGSGWLTKDKNTSGRPPFFNRTNTASNRLQQTSSGKIPDKEEATKMLQSIVHDLVDEVQAFFAAVGKEMPKDEMISRLKQLLTKYPLIRGSIYQEGINNLIAVNCESNCSIRFSAEEVDGLWQ